ncbi:MAG: hypothetical protein AAB801_02370 [Patescibacteria group bacterium]
MSNLLERALDDYRRGKEEEKLALEEQKITEKVEIKREEARMDAEFDLKALPIIKRFWEKNAPKELIELFDEFAKEVSKKLTSAKHIEQVKGNVFFQSKIFFSDPEEGHSSYLYKIPISEESNKEEVITSKEKFLEIKEVRSSKEKFLEILEKLEKPDITGRYYCDNKIEVRIPRSGGYWSETWHTVHLYFGFSFGESSEVVTWSSGGGDKGVKGVYTRTPESLNEVAKGLAAALEEENYKYITHPSPISDDYGGMH